MPYKTEKIPFDDPFLDRRRKLIPCQEEMILRLRKEGWSQRKLASRFNVSRRLIQFVLDPELKKRNYQRRVDAGGSKQYYDKDKQKEYIKSHRRYKHKTLKDTI